MKFADFHAGLVITLGPVSLSEEQILEFARQYEPERVPVETAPGGDWRAPIASGWQTCGVAMRLVSHHVLAGSESMGLPTIAHLKWPAPVRPGEALTLRIEVLEVRRPEHKPEVGLVRWHWRLRHADGRDALDLEATSLFKLGSGRWDAPGVDAVLAWLGLPERRAKGHSRALSEREIEVSRLLARGKTNKEIGMVLGISPRTVQIHVAHIFDKLGVHTRAGAAIVLVEHDLGR